MQNSQRFKLKIIELFKLFKTTEYIVVKRFLINQLKDGKRTDTQNIKYRMFKQ